MITIAVVLTRLPFLAARHYPGPAIPSLVRSHFPKYSPSAADRNRHAKVVANAGDDLLPASWKMCEIRLAAATWGLEDRQAKNSLFVLHLYLYYTRPNQRSSSRATVTSSGLRVAK
jgi:hypothetical protein